MGHKSSAVTFLSLIISFTLATAAFGETKVAVLSGEGERAVSDATTARVEAAMTEMKDIRIRDRSRWPQGFDPSSRSYAHHPHRKASLHLGAPTATLYRAGKEPASSHELPRIPSFTETPEGILAITSGLDVYLIRKT